MALTKVPYTDYQTVVTAQNLNDIQDEIISTTGYTTSNTPAAVAAKSAVLANYVLAVGASAKVKFTYSNTAANPTLNINATGAKPIVQYGATPVGATPATSWSEGEVLEFVYDGTNYVIVGRGEPIQPEDVGVGTLANLTTTAKTNAVAAINEVVADVSDLTDAIEKNYVSLADYKTGVANNLIPYPYNSESSTTRGLTFTVNADSSISYAGTPNSSGNPFINLKDGVLLKAGTYTLSNASEDLYGASQVWLFDDVNCSVNYSGKHTGLIKNSSDQVYVCSTRTGSIPSTTVFNGTARTFTIESDAYARFQIRTVNNTIGTAIEGTAYPMLEKGSVGHNWVSYADSIGGVQDAIANIGYHAIYTKLLTGISSLPKTFSGATGITADHEPIKGSAQVSPQSAMGGDWTVTCGDGTITVSGSFVGSTAATILMDFGIPDHETQTLT